MNQRRVIMRYKLQRNETQRCIMVDAVQSRRVARATGVYLL